MSRLERIIVVVFVLGLAVMLVVGASGCATDDPTGNGTTPAPETPAPQSNGQTEADPAKSLVDTKCSLCHTLERVYSAQKSREEWIKTIDQMKTHGLVVSDDEYYTILEFLATE